MTTFAQIVSVLRGGRTQSELDDAIQSVVEDVKEHRKAGSVTVTLKITPNGDTVLVSDQVKAAIPQEQRSNTVFFTDDHGNLLRRDPRQSELPLREVADDGPTELKEA